jgi:hypothetical protein
LAGEEEAVGGGREAEGERTMTPDAEQENALQWTRTASEHVTLQRVTELIFDRAAQAYRRGDDKTADAIWQLARDVDVLRADAETRLQVFIKAAAEKRAKR